MKVWVDSYRISGNFAPQRRETEKGANALADRMLKKRKHGKIERVLYDGDKIWFELVREL